MLLANGSVTASPLPGTAARWRLPAYSSGLNRHAQMVHRVNTMYQTSLAQFIGVFQQSMKEAEKAAIPARRIGNIVDDLTFRTFLYVTRGYLEIHKKIYALLLALKLQHPVQPLEVV